MDELFVMEGSIIYILTDCGNKLIVETKPPKKKKKREEEDED